MHCLFIHIPFIFVDKKELLEDIWLVVTTLLKSVEICFSKSICEKEILELESLIDLHLKLFKEIFKTHLRPKHHFLTHYPSAIRRMGPLIYYWMARFESKHLFFTNLAKMTNNYVNIAKTFAKRHQAVMAYSQFNISEIQPSKNNNKLTKTVSFSKYETQVIKYFSKEAIDDLLVLKFAIYNSFEYREGLMIIEKNVSFEIVHVFCLHGKIFLFCRPYRVVKFDPFFNSIEIINIDSNEQYELFDPLTLSNVKSYEKKFIKVKMYIICDTLDVRHILLQ